jgi:hypothetical protein
MKRDVKISRHYFAYANNVRTTRTGDIGPSDYKTKRYRVSAGRCRPNYKQENG